MKQDFQEAQQRIASYEIDIEKALSRPAFNDVTVPEVSEMVVQLRKCKRLVTSELSAVNASTVANEVDDLWVKVKAAEITAKRIAWSRISTAEQKDLKAALELVKQANDAGNPDELRRNLYSRLKQVVNRLDAGGVTIPAKIVEQVEHQARQEITESSLLDGNANKSEMPVR